MGMEWPDTATAGICVFSAQPAARGVHAGALSGATVHACYPWQNSQGRGSAVMTWRCGGRCTSHTATSECATARWGSCIRCELVAVGILSNISQFCFAAFTAQALSSFRAALQRAPGSALLLFRESIAHLTALMRASPAAGTRRPSSGSAMCAGSLVWLLGLKAPR